MNKGAALIILFVFCAINLDSAFAATQSPTELTGFDPDPVPLNYCINNCSFIGVCYPVHHGETSTTTYRCHCGGGFFAKLDDCSDYSLTKTLEELSGIEIAIIVTCCLIFIGLISICIWRRCCDRTRGFHLVGLNEKGLPKSRSFIISPFSTFGRDEQEDSTNAIPSAGGNIELQGRDKYRLASSSSSSSSSSPHANRHNARDASHGNKDVNPFTITNDDTHLSD